MASDAEELRKAQKLARLRGQGRNDAAIERRTRILPARELKASKARRQAARKKKFNDPNVLGGLTPKGRAFLDEAAQVNPNDPVTQRGIEIKQGLSRRKSSAAALPSISPVQGSAVSLRRPGGVPTFSGRGGEVTAEERAADAANPYSGTFQERLANFRRNNPPPRESINRGFQYQPSQWAEQTALRNARIGAGNQTIRNGLGRVEGTRFNQEAFDAIAQNDRRLQGLQRSKLYQDTRTQDQDFLSQQRGQDTVFLGATNRDRAQENIAGIEEQGALSRSRAQREYEAQKFGIQRSDKLRQQNLQNRNEMLQRRSTVDGEQDQGRYQQDLQFLTNSGLDEADVGVQERVLTMMDQFGKVAGYTDSVARSRFPTLARAIGGIFRKAETYPETAQQMEAIMREAINDPELLKQADLNDKEIAAARAVFGR